MNQGALCSTFQEIREVGVDDVRVTPEQQLLHVYDCLLGISPGTIGVDFRWEIGFEDRLQHQQRCCHADLIPHARDTQWPEFAVGFRYKHSSDRLWPVSLLPERKRQFSQPSLDPICLDIRKILAVDTRRPLVRAALGIGMRQNVVAADLVIQSIEAIAGLRLRFRAGIALVIEMTASFTMLLPMLAACFAAMLVPNLLGSAPIYESLRQRTARTAGVPARDARRSSIGFPR